MSGTVTAWPSAPRTGVLEERADVVVIGSGASGAAAARVFARAGLDVVMLEEGSPIPAAIRPYDAWSSFRQAWRDQGFQVAQGRMVLPVLQGKAVGGSTVIYGAIIHRIPEAIHAAWSREHGLGDALPMAELQRIYDELDVALSVAPPPPEVEGRNNQLMAEAARAMGITSNAIRRNVIGCEGSSRCLHGCPTLRKQSMDVTFLPEAVGLGMRLYANCRADRFELDGDRVRGVRATFVGPDGERGGELHVRADRVVVCASAIQTPQLLQRQGIGRSSGQVGKRLQGHPGSSIMGVFDEDVNIWYGATQGHETTHWWAEKMKFETVGVPLEVGAARLPGFGPALMRRMAGWGHVAQWGVQVRSDAHGTVKRGLFGGASIRYGFSQNDIGRLKVGLTRIAEMMFAAGAKVLYPGIHGLPDEITSIDGMKPLASLPDDPRLFHGIVSHMFGTAVMGPDRSRSVVGLDGQCHDVRGLYVLDSSIFPTNMGVNPAHTISAIATLLAERMVSSGAPT